MRRSADWMVLADDRILEFLNETGEAHSATTLKKESGISAARSSISKRLNRLADAGLLQRLPNGVFQITDKGEAYLNQEYDVDRGVYLERDDDADDPTPSTGEGVGGT
jgi:Mn-dependent DtxR family transcriptional regulator